MLVMLSVACDRTGAESRAAIRIDSARVVISDTLRHSAADSLSDTVGVANEPDSLAPRTDNAVTRPLRFGLVEVDSSGVPCLAIDGDSIAANTEVVTVGASSEDSPRHSQRIAKARIAGRVSGPCGDKSGVSDPVYRLTFVDEPGGSIGIVGHIDSLRLEDAGSVAKFPGDTAHWRFWTCTSAEGVHYQVGRRSADSIIVLWDGYHHVDYELEATCNWGRGLPRAKETRSLLADWNGGKRDHETAMRLAIARWNRCNDRMNDDSDTTETDTSAVIDSAAYPGTLPPMSDLLMRVGAPNDLSAEDSFVLAWLKESTESCVGPSIAKSPKQLFADAVRKDPASSLFRYFEGSRGLRRVSKNAAAAELHRRFDNRGEHYRMIGEWLRSNL